MNLIVHCIFLGLFCTSPTYAEFDKETYRVDGWFNNLANVQWGTAGQQYFNMVPTKYEDATYQAQEHRPNARFVSNMLFNGSSSEHSLMGRTTLFAFFSQMVGLEVTDSSTPVCPAEVLFIEVPENDTDFRPHHKLPFERAQYDRKTGQSLNNPRKQINRVTSWIDGSFIYGRGGVITHVLRSYKEGMLSSWNDEGIYPAPNRQGIPLRNLPSPVEHKVNKPSNMMMFGDPHSHESPPLLALGTMWFRYHNHVAQQYVKMFPHYSDEKLFHMARRWVIAVMQNIIVNEWLPAVLDEPEISPYEGYKPQLQPEVSSTFEAAASRFFYTSIPSGILRRNSTTCENKDIIRLCNSYGIGQRYLEESKYAVDEILFGMATQLAEKEDHIIVEDIRSKYWGPLHDTRQDAVALALMKGRDFGIHDYNTVRQHFGLPKKAMGEINPDMSQEMMAKMHEVYNKSMENLDVYTAGVMESHNGSFGELFKMVINEQLMRLRDSDRLWFENKENGMFNSDEIKKIKGTHLHHVLTAVIMGGDLLQDNVFFTKGLSTTANSLCKPFYMSTEMMNETCTPHTMYDYYVESEVSFIAAIVVLAVFPFLCVLVAYPIYLWNNYKMTLSKKKKDSERLKQIEAEKSERLLANEWLGHDEVPRTVEICMKHDIFSIFTINSKQPVRQLPYEGIDHILMGVSTDRHGESTAVMYVPKEYDLVLQFNTHHKRDEFVTKFRDFVEKRGKHLTCHSAPLKTLRNEANTKMKRQEILGKFFRSVFAEIDKYESGNEIINVAEKGQAKDIIATELSKHEFADALALKPDSSFVEQMFALLDKDGNGYISFGELLQAMVLFSKGSDEERLNLLFRMYDVDGNGTLEPDELRAMLRSLMEMASTSIPHEEIDKVINAWFESAGLTTYSVVSFENFKKLLSGHMNSLKLDWKGLKSVQAAGKPRKKSNAPKPTRPKSDDVKVSGKRESYNPVRAKLKSFLHFLENHKQHITILTLFYGLCLGLFVDKFFYYAVLTEHSGTRRIIGYGIPFARGSAASLSVCYAFTLLTMCRNTITFLRETFLNQYIPFDSNIAFHKHVAWAGLFWTAVHIIGHFFNLYHACTQPTLHLCMFNEVYFKSDVYPDFTYWLYFTLAGFAGLLATLIQIIIYIFATQTSRQYIFNAFWMTHKLMVPWYILLILHGSSQLIATATFHYYIAGPAILFTLDKLVSVSRKKTEISVISAELLPSDVTKIEFKRPANFEYKSGQWVRVACLPLGRNEYHPFTLTSSPPEDTLSLHIRSLGPWTWNLRNLLDPENLRDKPFPKLYLDGPYGSGHQDWYKYDVAVLVGGGIGVTPFASILKDFVHMSAMNRMYKFKCKKVYFFWVTASHRHFEWLIDILRQVEEVDYNNVVATHIFITQFFQKFDLRTTMLYICEEHFTKISNKSLFTGIGAQTHFGRPEFDKILKSIHESHPKVKKVGVFSCGPPGLTKNVTKGCLDASKSTKAHFEHHFENF